MQQTSPKPRPETRLAKVGQRLSELMAHEMSGGIVLMLAAALALLLDNSPGAFLYDAFRELRGVVRIGPLKLDKPLVLWINDGLMAVFFLLVGLEIKQAVLAGELSSFRKASLPLFAAVGGMVVPAVLFLFINRDIAAFQRGWAIPMATDIAFALGVLALLGKRVPVALHVFLLALAIIDDLGAILVIATVYTETLSLVSLGIAAVAGGALAALNLRGVTRIAPYILVGVVMWIAVLKSGVHATLAGVIVAMAIPLKGADGDDRHSPLRRLEHELAPWSTFAVLPLFAFANAGVALGNLTLDDLASPLTLGVAIGLFAGKQVGVLLFSWLATALKVAALPSGVSWAQLYGVAVLAGIGFTMSLFIGTLAFDDPALADQVRLGVLAGSILSALMGYAVLRWTTAEPRRS
ncbi:MAG: Na+/H+ antiporter NhaA [Hyphomicrobiaceae bacterium]